jgi:hypothetical protein
MSSENNNILENGQCAICNGFNCTYPATLQGMWSGGRISCSFLKELHNKISMLETNNIQLKQYVDDLTIKTLTKGDIINLFSKIDKNLNVSPQHGQNIAYLQNILQHKNLSVENRYFIFQQAITNKYPFLIEGQFTNIINTNVLNFVEFLKYTMDDDEENTLVEFIRCKSHQIFYALPIFFQLGRPELSEFLEDIMYEAIIERNTNPQYQFGALFTSGTWSINTILQSYKDANLGKAVSAIRKITSPHAVNSEIQNLVKKYPQAEKYAMLI